MKPRLVAFAVLAAGLVFAVYFWRFSSGTMGRTTGPVIHMVASRELPNETPHSAFPVTQASPPPAEITDHDHKLLGDLEQIFASKNDNDPRLDTEFRNLSPGTKLLLKQEYRKLAPESLNERGTIVFLIGRELKTPDDFAFLAQVGNQAPCLSLGDCKKQEDASEESMHEEVAVSVTLTYPQRVALKSLENLLKEPEVTSDQTEMALNTLGSITESPVGWVAQKAAKLESRYSGLRH